MKSARTTPQPGDNWLERFATERPDIALMAPMMVYLALLALRDQWFLPYEYRWVANLIRGIGGLVVVWLLYRPITRVQPWGKPHIALAAVCGLLIAAGWYYGQVLFDWMGVPTRLPLPIFPGEVDLENLTDPRDKLGDGLFFWSTVVTRIATASITVAFVEEIFWRGFLLRALIDWNRFEEIPIGTFTWTSFLLTSVISAGQHPDNWLISIPCWFAFNALIYWKRSVMFLVWVHGFTNLFLYIWVIYQGVHLGNDYAWRMW